MHSTEKCLCCDRKEDTRFGVCFECAEIQTIIVDGTDMYDKGLDDGDEPALKSLQKVKLLRQKGFVKRGI